MITVAGGKLTTYRSIAQEVVDRAVRELRFRDGARARPRRAPMRRRAGRRGGRLATFRERALEIGMAPDTVEHLLRHYGTESAGIRNLGVGDRGLLRRVAPPHPAIEAEVIHAARREMAQRVDDVLVRRTHIYYGAPPATASRPRGGWRSSWGEYWMGRGAGTPGGGALP